MSVTQLPGVLAKFVSKFNHNSNNKNRKIEFSFVSVQCAFLMQIWPLLRGRGEYLHILNWEKSQNWMVQEGTKQSEALHSYVPSCSLTNQEYHSKKLSTYTQQIRRTDIVNKNSYTSIHQNKKSYASIHQHKKSYASIHHNNKSYASKQQWKQTQVTTHRWKPTANIDHVPCTKLRNWIYSSGTCPIKAKQFPCTHPDWKKKTPIKTYCFSERLVEKLFPSES